MASERQCGVWARGSGCVEVRGHKGPHVSQCQSQLAAVTAERDAARAWATRWRAVATRLWKGVHRLLAMEEPLATRVKQAEAERDALREAGDELYQHVGEWRPGMTGTNVQTAQWKSARQQWRAARAALAARGGEAS